MLTRETLGDNLAVDILRDSLARYPWVQLRVSGDCMSPELCPGDTIRLFSTAARRPHWGDIVLVTCPEGIRLHRLVWNFPFLALTKADRSFSFDGVRMREAILASVTAVDLSEPSARAGWRGRFCALRSLAGGLTNWARLRALRAVGTAW